ncbi:hypothetical protein [Nitrosospira sp. NRS527]|uniref:hypothetical protein n=1 Tax=Nitrosospira sp. NRS527 TaxID=155925 RepID=UPI001AF54B86|nr:hypothetical protein [Nitrosospira sp. NRS527]BCT69596.1 hypothetical protein NNRS527_03221 [Nitrosospira sp. NRS527]
MKRNIVILVLVAALAGTNALAADAPVAADQRESTDECMRKLTENARKRHAEQSEHRIKRGLKPYRFTPPGAFQKAGCEAQQKTILNNTSWQ